MTATTPVLEARRTVDWSPEDLLRTCCDTTLCCWTPPDWVDKARARVDCCCPFHVICCCCCAPVDTWAEAWDITSTRCWSATDPSPFFFGTSRTWVIIQLSRTAAWDDLCLPTTRMAKFCYDIAYVRHKKSGWHYLGNRKSYQNGFLDYFGLHPQIFEWVTQSQELDFYPLIFSPFVHWSEQSLPASSCLLPPCPNWTAAAAAPAQFKCLVWIGIWFKLGPCTIIFLNISTLDKYLSEVAHLWYDHLLLLLPCCVDKKWLPVHLWMVDMLGEIFNSCESQIKSG